MVLKVDIPANRYDLLCMEGLCRAINTFNGDHPVRYSLAAGNTRERIVVEESVAGIRPVVMGAVLRDVKFSPESYDSFIDLQDKLHQNLARQRTLSSIGTHDLDTVKGPFKYKAVKPDEIRFVALKQSAEMTAPQLMELYEKDSFMKQYVPIIKEKERYPLITDANDIICSLPPIINGEHSKVTKIS